MSELKTTVQSIACGGTGGDLTYVDSKDGKIVRIRPIHYLDTYTEEELEPSMWEIKVGDKVFRPSYKALPNYFALAYKNRVYSKNRVRYPLKRVDWEPGGDPSKINAANRGKSKYVRISWDEALDIMESEIRRIIDTYGAYSVLTIGEDGHRESKNLHSGGGMHSTLMSKLGGYTREVRTPDSVEGWYWGAKHFWGSGCNKGLGMPAPPQTGYNPWHVLRDISEHSEMIAFAAGDWELTQNYASQLWSRLLKFWEECGKKFVVVDPFCNYTACCHDYKWIPILPNTDAALDFAVMYVWFTEDLYDKEYCETHTVGLDKVKAYVLGTDEEGIPKTPAWAAERTGIPEYTIKAYARNRARFTTASVHFSSGAIKGPYSFEPGRTHAYLLGLQGLGKPGVQQAYMNSSLIGKETIARSTSAPFSMSNQCRMFYPSEQKIPRTMIAEALLSGKAEWYGSPAIVYVETSEQFEKNTYPTTPETYLAALGSVSPELARAQGKSVEELQAALDYKKQHMPKFEKIHMLWSEKPRKHELLGRRLPLPGRHPHRRGRVLRDQPPVARERLPLRRPGASGHHLHRGRRYDGRLDGRLDPLRRDHPSGLRPRGRGQIRLRDRLRAGRALRRARPDRYGYDLRRVAPVRIPEFAPGRGDHLRGPQQERLLLPASGS